MRSSTWGHVTVLRQLRFLLVEAAQVTVRSQQEWRSKFFHLAMRRGRKIAKVAMEIEEVSGISFSMLRKSMSISACSRFAIRNLVHVFPDRGYDTIMVSSGRTAKFRPAWSRPITYLATYTMPYITTTSLSDDNHHSTGSSHVRNALLKSKLGKLAGPARNLGHRFRKRCGAFLLTLSGS